MSLRPIQLEALSCKFGNIGVGQGKTLVSFLLPVALKATTTVILTKPTLLKQAARLYEEYVQHWRLPELAGSDVVSSFRSPGVVHLVSYSSLSSIKAADTLDRIKPDLVVCDEAHCLAYPTSARTKRFKRYFKQNPETKLVCVSGSLITGSIKNAAHLSAMSLGMGSPFPLNYATLEEWSLALDPGDLPADAGVLREFCRGDETPLEGFHRRVFQTPGALSSDAGSLSCSLTLKPFKPNIGKEITTLLKKQNATWETPDGEVITDAASKWRHDGEVSCGFFYRRIWPRGEPVELQRSWLEARANYRREVSAFLKRRSSPGMDSPKLLEEAAKTGRWGAEFYAPWAAIKNEAKPDRETVWVSTDFLEAVKHWGQANNGVIWYEHKAFGERLAAETGWPHLSDGDEGQDVLKSLLNKPLKTPIIASRPAFGTGTDGLQELTNTQLFTFPPSGPKAWEQALGRIHRHKQNAPDVEAHVAWHTEPAREAFLGAYRKALFDQTLTSTAQKLIYADKEGDLLSCCSSVPR